MKVYCYDNKNTSKSRNLAFPKHWTSGINRRNFVKSSLALSLLATISGCKPVPLNQNKDKITSNQLIHQSADTVKLKEQTFNTKQLIDLQAVSMRLFPDDGDGPSANDLHFLTYLEWAMTDEQNSADGDPEFIAKGIGWLNQFSNDDFGADFIGLSTQTQDDVLTKTSQSDVGERWLALLIYYLIEALTLDPFYGGNTNQLGWNWLEHQGGFPHPIQGKTYRDFS